MSAPRVGDPREDPALASLQGPDNLARAPMPAKALLAKQVSLDAPLLPHGAAGAALSLAKTPSLPTPGARLSPPLRGDLPAGGIRAFLDANLANALPGARPGLLATAWMAARLRTAGGSMDGVATQEQRHSQLEDGLAPAQGCPGMGQLAAAGRRPGSPAHRPDGGTRAAQAASVRAKGEPDLQELASSRCSVRSMTRIDLRLQEGDAARCSSPNAAPAAGSRGPAAMGRCEALVGSGGLDPLGGLADAQPTAGIGSLAELFKRGAQELRSGHIDAPDDLWKPCRLLKDDDSYIGLGAMAERFLSSALDDAPAASTPSAGMAGPAEAGSQAKGVATPLQKSSSLGKTYSSSSAWCPPGRRSGGSLRPRGGPDASPDQSAVTAGDASHQRHGRRDESDCSLRTLGSGGLEEPGFVPPFPLGALSALDGTRLAAAAQSLGPPGIDISNPRGASLLASLLDQEIGGGKSRLRASEMFAGGAPAGDQLEGHGAAQHIPSAAGAGAQLGRAGSWRATEARGDEQQQLIAALKGHLPGGVQPLGRSERDAGDGDRPGSGDDVTATSPGLHRRWGGREGGGYDPESPRLTPQGHKVKGALGKRKAEVGPAGRERLSRTSSEEDRGEAKERERRERRMALNREAARRMRQRNADRLAELERTVESLRKDGTDAVRRLEQAERRVCELEDANEKLEGKLRKVVGEILTGDYAPQAVKDGILAVVGALGQELAEQRIAQGVGEGAASKEEVCRVVPQQGPSQEAEKCTQLNAPGRSVQGMGDGVPASEQLVAPSGTA